MPVTPPPVGGPLGRARRRLSGSGYSTWERCQTEWRMSRELGLGWATSPSQVLGHVLEEGMVRLLMRHPPAGLDRASLLQWINQGVAEEAVRVREDGVSRWSEVPWKRLHDGKEDWPYTIEDLAVRLGCGMELMMVEVDACLEAEGGPYLALHRSGGQPHDVPAPSDGSVPRHPLPDRWPLHLDVKPKPAFAGWEGEGAPVTASEAWEIVRPWVKDPRVMQPQRMFHPEGWAAGELDLVLRWNGKTRLVDLKSGDGMGPYATGLHDQLRFYGWLWECCFDEVPDGLEGWYLDGGLRRPVEPFPDHVSATASLKAVAEAMGKRQQEGPVQLPLSEVEACSRPWCPSCALATKEGVEGLLRERLGEDTNVPKTEAPFEPLSSIPSRVNVQGRLDGLWGPMPNHFGESVIGAALSSGRATVAIEETEPGSNPGLHAPTEGDVVVLGALPGAWRGAPRLYADEHTRIVPSSEESSITRLGLLRTRANVRGRVLSIGRNAGLRLDGRPWSMATLHLWDGHHVIEVAMFGGSLTDRLLAIRPGDTLALVGAELGWREGMPQLRIDMRSTRVDVEHQAS